MIAFVIFFLSLVFLVFVVNELFNRRHCGPCIERYRNYRLNDLARRLAAPIYHFVDWYHYRFY